MRDLQRGFLRDLSSGEQMLAVFDLLPDAYFFTKDASGVFIFANDAEAVAFGVDGPADIVGKTDYDFFDEDIAGRYLEEDREVMQSRTPVKNKLWLVPNKQGELNWYLCSKLPPFSKAGDVLGIAGVMRDVSTPFENLSEYRNFSEVLRFVQDRYQDPISVKELAAVARMSVSSLERRFRELFKLSPMRYVTQVRVQAAAMKLRHTGLSISEIAVACGFCDQSHLHRHFKAARGLTPRRYRDARGGGGPPEAETGRS